MSYKNIGIVIVMAILGYFVIENSSAITLTKAPQTSSGDEALSVTPVKVEGSANVSIDDEKTLTTEDDRPIVLLFTADWCHGCRSFKPEFAKSKRNIGDGYKYVEVNIDKNRKLARYFNVPYIPILYIYDKKNNYKAKVDMYNYERDLKNYLTRTGR